MVGVRRGQVRNRAEHGFGLALRLHRQKGERASDLITGGAQQGPVIRHLQREAGIECLSGFAPEFRAAGNQRGGDETPVGCRINGHREAQILTGQPDPSAWREARIFGR